MKILLVQNSVYLRHGGANKANQLLLEGLVERGHTCRAVTPAYLTFDHGAKQQLLDELASRALVAAAHPDEVVFSIQGVEVHAATDISRTQALVARQIREFEPAWVLISEDPGQRLLKAALDLCSTRVVCLVHTPPTLPFGPLSFFPPSSPRTALFQQAAGVITVSRYAQEYLKRWGGLDSAVIPFPAYGKGPFPQLGCFDRGYVTLVNPCDYKGLPIFLELARRLPDVAFAAVPTWGTTEADVEALRQLANIHILKAVDDVDQLFAQTRVLLMPSLWAEAFPLVSVEAMLRGVPVVASDAGGLPEAKLGVDYVLPVRHIERYERQLNDRLLPEAVVPEQDPAPWLETLRTLLSNRALYERLSAASRVAALEFVATATAEAFEAYLERLESRARAHPQDGLAGQERELSQAEKLLQLVGGLSLEKRALLAQRLRKRGGQE